MNDTKSTPSSHDLIPRHILRGDARAIGLQHGTLLKDRIHKCIALYTTIMGAIDPVRIRHFRKLVCVSINHTISSAFSFIVLLHLM
jgi:hypothetical protein